MNQVYIDRENCPWSMIFRFGSQYPERVALISPDGSSLTYRELSARVNAGILALQDRGIGRESRVAVVMPNGLLLAETILTVSALACCAPLSPRLTAEEFGFEFSDLGCSALVTTGSVNSPARDVASELGIDIINAGCSGGLFPGTAHASGDRSCDEGVFLLKDYHGPCLVMHTSGTTARPKIVPLSRINLSHSAARIAESLSLTHDDRCLNVMPLFHVHGLIGCLFSSLQSGGSVVCTPGYLQGDFFSWIREFSPTWYSAVPTIHEEVYRHGIEMPGPPRHHLRFIRSCSSPLSPSLAVKLEGLFSVPVIEAYGMSEAAHQISVNPLPPGKRKHGSVGLPAGCEVGVLSPWNRLLPAGTTGEIAIRGKNVISGYDRNPEANAGSFTPGGWLRTGDQGYRDKEGYIYLTGRIKEIINKGGEKVSPREIEEVFMGHPDILTAVSFSFPHQKLGEDIAIAVIPAPGKTMTVSQLRHYALQHLAPFKVPSKYFIVPEIPKGPTGKIKRSSLPGLFHITSEERADIEAGQKNRPISPPRNPQDRLILDIWQDVLGISPVGIDDDFFSLGGTSLTAVDLVTKIYKEMKTSLAPTILYRAPTVRELSDLINSGIEDTKYLLPLQLHGERIPLYLVPPSDGSAFFYAPLAEFLGAGQPIYSFSWPGIDGREPAPHDIRDIAGRFLKDIRTRQQGQPFIIGGFCFGGLVAFEMARQVLEDTADPAILILLDPDVPMNGPGWELPRSNRMKNLRGEARLYRERGLRFFGRVQVLRVRRIIESLRMDYIRRLYRRVQRGHVTSSLHYIADYYPGSVVVIMSEEYSGNRLVPKLKELLTGPAEYKLIKGSGHRELLSIGAAEISMTIACEVLRETGKDQEYR